MPRPATRPAPRALGVLIALCLASSLVAAQTIRAGSDPVPLLLASATALRSCYSFNGTGNNFGNPLWGSVGEELLRPEGANYENGSWHFMRGGPNPRSVSNVMSHETCTDSDRLAETCINDWFWLWGQFIDHDLTHVPLFPKGLDNTTMDIPVPGTDPFLAGRSLPMRRSAVTDNVEQLNLATAYLDGSQIYGTSEASARRVRTLAGGRLLVTQDGFMPVIPARMRMDHSATPTFDELGHPAFRDQFLCADMRCNQHAPMAALQAMFVREHNRIAAALAAARHPAYQTDESIYQAARAMVIAMIQSITYREFLPLLMGRFGTAPYTGYKPDVPPGISNAFTTAGFRTSHSMVRCDFRETTSGGQTLRAINFATSFFDSTWIRGPPAQPNRQNREQNAYQTIMHALAVNPSARMDHRVAPALRSVLFSPSATASGEPFPAVAFDVIAADVQRGRDHGLLDYRRMRRAQGWADIGSIFDITADRAKQSILMSLYPDINSIDLFSGMMLEDPLEGALTGPVTTSVVRDQFERARDGDRCWFENQFQGQLLTLLRGIRLRDLVDRNFQNPPAAQTLNADGIAAATTAEGFTLLRNNAPRAMKTMHGHGGGSGSGHGHGRGSGDAAQTRPAGRPGPEVDLRSWDDREQALQAAGATSGQGGVPGHRPRGGPLPGELRPASAVDDVVGYRCDGSNDCEAVTMDAPLDPEIIAIAREIRDRRRAESTFAANAAAANAHAAAAAAHANVAGAHTAFGVAGAAPGVAMSTMGSPLLPLQYPHAHPVFGTLRVSAGLPTFHGANPHTQTPALLGGLPHPRFATLQANGANNNNGANVVRNLQPAPGILQTVNRAALPTVPQAVLVENIFLTPQCRR